MEESSNPIPINPPPHSNQNGILVQGNGRMSRPPPQRGGRVPPPRGGRGPLPRGYRGPPPPRGYRGRPPPPRGIPRGYRGPPPPRGYTVRGGRVLPQYPGRGPPPPRGYRGPPPPRGIPRGYRGPPPPRGYIVRGGRVLPQYPRGGQCAPPRGRGRYPARARGRGRGRIRKPMTPPSPPKKEKKAFPKAKMKLREGEEENDFSSMLMTMSSKAFSLASKEPKVKSSIRVLTCSANLGNAQPDDYSMDEWIPRDGDMRLVVQDEPIFPLFRTYEGKIQADMDKSRHMKIKELKKALTAKGIKTKQFVEKSEFLRAYVEAGGTAEPEEPVEEEQQQETNIEDADAELQDDAFDAFFATRATSHKKVADDGDPPGEKFREDDDYEAFLVAKDIVDNYEAFTAAVDADIDFDNLDDQNQDADYEFEADFDTEWSAFDNQPYEEEDQYEDERPAEHFDIIVIGMQEATFETEGVDDDFLNDENSDSGSEDDDDRTNESIGSLEEQDDLETPVETLSPMKSSKSKNLSGKVLSASLKAGKAALKAGAKVGSKTVKVGNKTLKTAAAAKTLITEYNHTKKSAPTPQQAATPMMDGGKSDWNDTAVLHFLFDGQLPSYERALSYQLGEMRLMVYYRESAVDVNLLSVKTQATGKHGLANKGGIVAEVAVNQSTRLAFMTAHLEAHEGAKKYEKRCSSFRSIMRGTKSSATPFRYDASLASHFSFFMGDLNFRTKLPDCEAGSPEHIQACHNLVAERNWVKLNKHDELAKALRDKECLVGWRTPYCNFDPTFKVARQDGYEYNVKRSPSYTDRILFKTGDQLEPSLEVLAYEPIRGFTSSDHKPIRGAYSIKLNEELGIEEEKSEEKSCKENFHLFVSSIECEINQETYNRDRQTSDAKVEPPCPFVSLVSTPSEALLSDDNKKGGQWKSFGLGKIKKMTKKLAYDDDLNAKKKSSSSASKWPGTSVLVSTFDPKWSGEEIHFQVRTLEDDGGQIDLSGALLHISLFDFKGTEAKLLGSFSLNLARLIKISKEKLPSPLLARTNETEEVSNGTGWSYSPEKTPSAALLDAANKDAPSPVKTISKSMLERQSKDENKPEKRPIRGMLAREVSQTRLMAKPSPEFCDIMNEASDDKESSDGRVDASEKCSDLKIVSMKIDELLTESGIEIGRITCSIDAWWMAVKDS